MKRAGKRGFVAPLAATQGSAPVRTGIQDGIKLAVFIACDHYRLTTDIGSKIVACFRDLTLVSQKYPVTFKNVLHLKVKQGLIGKDTAITTIMTSRRPCRQPTCHIPMKLQYRT